MYKLNENGEKALQIFKGTSTDNDNLILEIKALADADVTTKHGYGRLLNAIPTLVPDKKFQMLLLEGLEREGYDSWTLDQLAKLLNLPERNY